MVASNLFGDILSDLPAAITRSIALAASGNLDPQRPGPSMFEPVHGSAPDIAAKGVVKPLAAILSSGMLLEHPEQAEAALAVENAVRRVLAEGNARTPDLGGRCGTLAVALAVVEAI